MASMSAGNVTIVNKEMDKLLELARRNQYQLSEASYAALLQLVTATAVTYS